MILIKSILLGLLLIGFLIFKGNIERLIIVALILIIINIFKSAKFKANCILVVLSGIIIGYILGNFLLFYSILSSDNGYKYSRRDNIEEGKDNKLSKPAVIIFSNGEPYLYDSSIVLKNIYNGKSFIKKAKAPIEAFKYKMAYENMGSSKYSDLCNRIKDNLAIRLGVDYDLYSAYFNVYPFLYDEIVKLSKRYEKIILVPLILGESEEYQILKKQIEEDFININTDIRFSPFLWESKKLPKQILEKSIKAIGNDLREASGIILIISDRESIYDQTIFSNRLIAIMEQANFEKEKIICLKHNDDENLLLKSIHNLKTKGASNILIISISTLLENVKDQYNIGEWVKSAAKKEFIDIKYINGWGIGENLLNELEYKIRITNLKN
ncbi:hypothetical protein [Maledivibacter halophilus]|nr:hypothetical protein [Maledivibacter halophilus]